MRLESWAVEEESRARCWNWKGFLLVVVDEEIGEENEWRDVFVVVVSGTVVLTVKREGSGEDCVVVADSLSRNGVNR